MAIIVCFESGVTALTTGRAFLAPQSRLSRASNELNLRKGTSEYLARLHADHSRNNNCVEGTHIGSQDLVVDTVERRLKIHRKLRPLRRNQ